MAKLIKQITPVTLSRILRLLNSLEEDSAPFKLTCEIRTNHSGCVRDEFSTVIHSWADLNEFNDLIVEHSK
jgi:hypothetical protein